MKCQDVREELVASMDGPASPAEQSAVAAHLEACAACRQEAADLRRAEDALRALAALERAPDLAADLRRRLAARPARQLPRLPAGTALAVVIAAAAALFLLRPRPPATHTRPPSRQAEVAAAPPGVEPLPAPAVEPKMKPAAPPRPKFARYRIARRRSPPAEAPGETPRREPAAPEATAAEAATPGAPEAPYGVILLLGPPQEPLSPSSCYVEVSMPDGRKSILQQDVEVDATGQPAALRLAYENIEPGTRARKEGG